MEEKSGSSTNWRVHIRFAFRKLAKHWILNISLTGFGCHDSEANDFNTHSLWSLTEWTQSQKKVKTNKVHKFKLLLKWKECRSNGFFREMLEWKRRQMHTASRCINNHLTFYLCIRSLIKTFVMWFRFAIQGSKLFDAKVNDIMMSSNGRQHSIIHSFFPACHFLRACFDSNNAPNGRSRLKFTATEYIRFYVLRSNQIDRIRLKSRARSAYYKWFPVKFPLTRLCIDGAWVLVVFRSYLSIFAKGVFNHPDVLLLISYFHNNISIFAAAAHKNNNSQPHASKVHRY